ncbi:MAG: PAS domain S-box protein [Xenococcaceae cyanobacterium MO_167.B52]|nr:PAS domain S-box protein [Xenococcaceae cyanobacterium MO_167.B52]
MNNINQQLKDKISELEQKEASMRQQEEFLRLIYNNVREAIFVIDVGNNGEFYYQGFNPAATRLTGIKDVLNKTPIEILSPEMAAKVEQNYQKCLDLKATITYEEYLPFQGKDRWWLTTLNPVEDQTGKIYRIVGTSLDITKRKTMELELDKKNNFLEKLLDNLSDGIVSCDRNGSLTVFNKATREFHGLPRQAIPAEQWAEYYDLYLSDGKTMMSKEDIPLFRALQGESVRDVEMMIIPKQGKPRTLLANGDPILNSNGEKIGAIATMRDITERKQAEKAVAQLNEELEARVQQRTLQLEQANKLLLGATQQLKKSNQELEQFAYVTSHDLKAPLRAIANLSEWIEEDLEDKLDDDTRYNMNLLRSRVHRLENLINGLLAYSRVGRLKSAPQTVVVGELIAEIIDSLDVPDNFVIETIGEMPTLVTEITPLNQVFSNLLANAIKHSDCNNGRITISVTEQADCYEFSVGDNGKGIAPQYHEKIFTIFQTLEARDVKESTGIGLAIVKKAVENQGGTVKVESNVGAGATFTFSWRKLREDL